MGDQLKRLGLGIIFCVVAFLLWAAARSFFPEGRCVGIEYDWFRNMIDSVSLYVGLMVFLLGLFGAILLAINKRLFASFTQDGPMRIVSWGLLLLAFLLPLPLAYAIWLPDYYTNPSFMEPFLIALEGSLGAIWLLGAMVLGGVFYICGTLTWGTLFWLMAIGLAVVRSAIGSSYCHPGIVW